MVIELIECIHCGFKFLLDIEKYMEEGETTATRNISDLRKQNRNLRAIDIICAKCNKTFEYKVRS